MCGACVQECVVLTQVRRAAAAERAAALGRHRAQPRVRVRCVDAGSTRCSG